MASSSPMGPRGARASSFRGQAYSSPTSSSHLDKHGSPSYTSPFRTLRRMGSSAEEAEDAGAARTARARTSSVLSDYGRSLFNDGMSMNEHPTPAPRSLKPSRFNYNLQHQQRGMSSPRSTRIAVPGYNAFGALVEEEEDSEEEGEQLVFSANIMPRRLSMHSSTGSPRSSSLRSTSLKSPYSAWIPVPVRVPRLALEQRPAHEGHAPHYPGELEATDYSYEHEDAKARRIFGVYGKPMNHLEVKRREFQSAKRKDQRMRQLKRNAAAFAASSENTGAEDSYDGGGSGDDQYWE